jgi:hypothetical protein
MHSLVGRHKLQRGCTLCSALHAAEYIIARWDAIAVRLRYLDAGSDDRGACGTGRLPLKKRNCC